MRKYIILRWKHSFHRELAVALNESLASLVFDFPKKWHFKISHSVTNAFPGDQLSHLGREFIAINILIVTIISPKRHCLQNAYSSIIWRSNISLTMTMLSFRIYGQFHLENLRWLSRSLFEVGHRSACRRVREFSLYMLNHYSVDNAHFYAAPWLDGLVVWRWRKIVSNYSSL